MQPARDASIAVVLGVRIRLNSGGYEDGVGIMAFVPMRVARSWCAIRAFPVDADPFAQYLAADRPQPPDEAQSTMATALHDAADFWKRRDAILGRLIP